MARPIVLVVDDEAGIRDMLELTLEGDYEVQLASTAEDARQHLAGGPVDAVLLDVRLGPASGLDVLADLKGGKLTPDVEIPVIMISADATYQDAIQATRVGAFDFLDKPLQRERVHLTLRNALQHRRTAREAATLRAAVDSRAEIIGESSALAAVHKQIGKVGPTKGRVLITGESGTGKELVARALHLAWVASLDRGKRERVPFVKLNCAAIAPELIESELFGHEKGAFTGAHQRKRGLFEMADGGTIFLDEIGDMAPAAQAKVLRVLQQGEVVRVGGEKVFTVDCRVIAATNKDLQVEVAQGRFREDLYFRLNVIPITVPPLRARLEDVPALATAFVRQSCLDNGFKAKRLAPEALARLQAYTWPGNVRELRNVIERCVILAEDEIGPADLPDFIPVPAVGVTPGGQPAPVPEGAPRGASLDPARYLALPLREFRDEVEKEYLRLRLEETGWNVSRTAQALGIERTNLHKRLKALGLSRE